MKGILELKPIDDESNVNWVVIKRPTGTYIGQANYSTREGRGGYHFKEDGSTWIGYWGITIKVNMGNCTEKMGNLYTKESMRTEEEMEKVLCIFQQERST